MANPVIEAVLAGHAHHGASCTLDKESWPCRAILMARRDHRLTIAAEQAAVPKKPAAVRFYN